jgi:hypothetical protein
MPDEGRNVVQGPVPVHEKTTTKADADPDVHLDVPTLKVDEIDLYVEDLRARVSLHAEVLDLLKLDVGVDVVLGQVELDIKGVEAQALLNVRLDNVATILGDVLNTIDRNPQLLEQITAPAGDAVAAVGHGAGRAVGELGHGAGEAVEEVGVGAGQAVDSAGRALGETAGDVADHAGRAVEEAGSNMAGTVTDAGGVIEGAAEVTSDAAESTADKVAETSEEAAARTEAAVGAGDAAKAPPAADRARPPAERSARAGGDRPSPRSSPRGARVRRGGRPKVSSGSGTRRHAPRARRTTG